MITPLQLTAGKPLIVFKMNKELAIFLSLNDYN